MMNYSLEVENIPTLESETPVQVEESKYPDENAKSEQVSHECNHDFGNNESNHNHNDDVFVLNLKSFHCKMFPNKFDQTS